MQKSPSKNGRSLYLSSKVEGCTPCQTLSELDTRANKGFLTSISRVGWHACSNRHRPRHEREIAAPARNEEVVR